MHFDLNKFISKHVTGRPESLFQQDIAANREVLRSRIDGKSALVIGGAGTIGASYIRALLKHGKLSRLYVVDINENGLTELTRDIRSSNGLHIPPDYKTYPVNFGDAVFEKIFLQEGPFEIVANFAAHKHVRSEKDRYSIEAMLDNNVLKAKRLLDMICERPPERFFCVSTDKAANPVNVMGASKKLMEEVILAYASRLQITTARFANVAFSNGSLPAGFLERIAKGQPLSAPKHIRRYFVSPAESGEICMLACLLGESGDIFFPRLDAANNMKTFTYIADNLLESLGYVPDYSATEEEAKLMADAIKANGSPAGNSSYPVYYFESDTSGEKPFEEFFTDSEEIDLAAFQSLGIIKNTAQKNLGDIEIIFQQFRALFDKPELDKAAIIACMKKLIPNFEHIETGKSLDQKM
jgi:FlaA1/EpsC-like NDP-sugar epimerase